MSQPAAACSEPLSLEALAAYWQAELPEADSDAVEEHLFACAECTRRLEAVAALGAGIAELVRGGLVFTAATRQMLERAAAGGLRMGLYELQPGQSVQCTMAPGDACNVVRLGADFEGVERVDLGVVQIEDGRQTFAEHLADLPVDRLHNEVVLVHPAERLRPLPTATFHLELVAHDAAGRERPLGRYTLNHSASPA